MQLDDSPSHSTEKKRSRVRRVLMILVAFLIVSVVGGKVWYSYKFPYGWSHCCSAGMGLSLFQYASEHDGWLPHGKETPEASLSILCSNDATMVEWVRG